jgi:hypothetical protein
MFKAGKEGFGPDEPDKYGAGGKMAKTPRLAVYLATVRKYVEVGHRVRLKTAPDPPANIPAGAIGSVTRISG